MDPKEQIQTLQRMVIEAQADARRLAEEKSELRLELATVKGMDNVQLETRRRGDILKELHEGEFKDLLARAERAEAGDKLERYACAWLLAEYGARRAAPWWRRLIWAVRGV